MPNNIYNFDHNYCCINVSIKLVKVQQMCCTLWGILWVLLVKTFHKLTLSPVDIRRLMKSWGWNSAGYISLSPFHHFRRVWWGGRRQAGKVREEECVCSSYPLSTLTTLICHRLSPLLPSMLTFSLFSFHHGEIPRRWLSLNYLQLKTSCKSLFPLPRPFVFLSVFIYRHALSLISNNIQSVFSQWYHYISYYLYFSTVPHV